MSSNTDLMPSLRQGLKPSEVIIAIVNAVHSKTVLMLEGAPGTAKSALMMEAATALDMAYSDIRMGQMEPTDLRGIPFAVVEHGVHRIKWSSPAVLPHEIDISAVMHLEYAETVKFSWKLSNPLGKNGIYHVQKPNVQVKSLTPNAVAMIIDQSPVHATVAMFAASADGSPSDRMIADGHCRITVTGSPRVFVGMDEFSSASPSCVAVTYELILDRRTGEYVVPPDCYLMAAGNRDTDGAIAFRIGTAASSRMSTVTSAVDMPEWRDWAIKKGINASVINFISGNEELLFVQPTNQTKGTFENPRTWHMTANVIDTAIEKNEPKKVMLSKIIGLVGTASAHKIMIFLDRAAALPDPADVLDGKLTTVPFSTDRSLALEFVDRLCFEMKKRLNTYDWVEGEADPPKEWYDQANRVFGYFLNNPKHFTPEMGVVMIRRCRQEYKLPFRHSMSNLKMFAKTHGARWKANEAE